MLVNASKASRTFAILCVKMALKGLNEKALLTSGTFSLFETFEKPCSVLQTLEIKH